MIFKFYLIIRYGFPDVQHLDFQKDPRGSQKIVNQWVSNKTRGQIEDLIDEEQIDSLTRLVLANAISLKVVKNYIVVIDENSFVKIF